jgi:hypothetical protein
VQLTREPQFNNLVVFKVDFDNQKADVRALKAQQQSTLILYKARKAARSATPTKNPSPRW